MKKSNLFKIVNGVKVYASFHKVLKVDNKTNTMYESSEGGYFVEDGRGGTMFLYWDLAVIYAEFISYGLTPREAWEAACAFFDDPEHARVNYVHGLIIDTCQNKGRAAAVIEAREAAANVSEEKESAEETPAATIKEAENTADDAQAAVDRPRVCKGCEHLTPHKIQSKQYEIINTLNIKVMKTKYDYYEAVREDVKEFKKWSRDMKREIKRLEKAGDYEQAAWLANAHARQVIGMFA